MKIWGYCTTSRQGVREHRGLPGSAGFDSHGPPRLVWTLPSVAQESAVPTRPTPLDRRLRTRRLGAMSTALALLVGGLLVAAPAPAAAPSWDTWNKLCKVRSARVKENSGMSRSTYARPVMFAHNDSGGGPQFFALGTGCRMRAVFDVPGAPAKDWEDMASGVGHTLWFGDIGGNRDEVNVVRVKEPRRLRGRRLGHTAYRLAYPDGSHNAESMMIRPRTGRLFIVTKAPDGAGIYRAPKKLDPDAVNTLTRVADAPPGLSGADFSRDGNHLLLRSYHRAWVYAAVGGTDRVTILLPEEHTFGEAGMFTRGGALVFGAEGIRQWLWQAKP